MFLQKKSPCPGKAGCRFDDRLAPEIQRGGVTPFVFFRIGNLGLFLGNRVTPPLRRGPKSADHRAGFGDHPCLFWQFPQCLVLGRVAGALVFFLPQTTNGKLSGRTFVFFPLRSKPPWARRQPPRKFWRRRRPEGFERSKIPWLAELAPPPPPPPPAPLRPPFWIESGRKGGPGKISKNRHRHPSTPPLGVPPDAEIPISRAALPVSGRPPQLLVRPLPHLFPGAPKVIGFSPPLLFARVFVQLDGPQAFFLAGKAVPEEAKTRTCPTFLPGYPGSGALSSFGLRPLGPGDFFWAGPFFGALFPPSARKAGGSPRPGGFSALPGPVPPPDLRAAGPPPRKPRALPPAETPLSSAEAFACRILTKKALGLDGRESRARVAIFFLPATNPFERQPKPPPLPERPEKSRV